MNLGNYEAAIADFERTSGPGPENLGSLDTLMERAKKQLAAANEPAPEPVRPAPEPSVPHPRRSSLPRLRPDRSSIRVAESRFERARPRQDRSCRPRRRAKPATRRSTRRPEPAHRGDDANTSARTNDDLNAIIDMAESAGISPSWPCRRRLWPRLRRRLRLLPAVTPKPTAAANTVLADYSNDVRRALENYFAGEFEAAARDFQRLSARCPATAGSGPSSAHRNTRSTRSRRTTTTAFRLSTRLRRRNA